MLKFGHTAAYAASLVLLVACGGGSDSLTPGSTGSSSSISGVAAAGAPIKGTVKIKDSTGKVVTTTIGSGGNYSISTSGMTPPFILLAEGTVSGRAYSITSPATSSDVGKTVNITPLTDLVLGNVMGQDGETAFQSGNFGNILDLSIDAHELALTNSLTGILTDTGFSSSQSMINTAFSANHTGIDLALDMLNVDVDKATDTATISLIDGSASVTDDLTAQSAITALSSSGDQTTSIAEYNAILSVINSFVSSLNSGTSASTLTTNYFAATFLDDGVGSAIFLNNIGAGSSPGIAMSDIAISNLDLTPGSENATVRFMVSFGGVLYGSAEMQLIKDATQGWLLNGNQKLASISLRPYTEKISTYQRATGETTSYNSGLHLSMDISDASDNGINNGITQATLTGPGITSPVVLTPHSNLSTRFVNGSSWDGYIPLNDTDIASIKEGSLYTLVVDYNDGTTKQVSYSLRLNKPPLTSAQASSQSYTAITSPASATALDNMQGSNMSVSWTLGNELSSFDTDARSFCLSTGTSYGGTKSSLLSDSSGTLGGNYSYLSTDACEGILRVRSLDKFNGEVVTTYKIIN